MPKFLKQIRPLGWLLIALLVAAIVLMVVNCGGDKLTKNATPVTSTPPPHLSNEVPDDEQAQQELVDSLNAENP